MNIRQKKTIIQPFSLLLFSIGYRGWLLFSSKAKWEQHTDEWKGCRDIWRVPRAAPSPEILLYWRDRYPQKPTLLHSAFLFLYNIDFCLVWLWFHCFWLACNHQGVVSFGFVWFYRDFHAVAREWRSELTFLSDYSAGVAVKLYRGIPLETLDLFIPPCYLFKVNCAYIYKRMYICIYSPCRQPSHKRLKFVTPWAP